jgi:hypothetical protein
MSKEINIKTYLTDYLTYLKEYKIKSDFKHAKKYYNLSKDFLQNGGINNKIEYSTDKAKKIAEVFALYNKLGPEQTYLNEQMEDLVKKIDEISNKIKDVDINNLNIQKINKDDLDKVIISLTDGTTLDELNTKEFQDSISYYKRRIFDYGEFSSQNYTSKILTEIENRIKKIIAENANISDNDKRFDLIKEEISNFNTKIDSLRVKLEQENTEMEEEIKAYNDMIEFAYVKGELKTYTVKDFENMRVSRTRTIRNNFLQYQATGGKLSVISMLADNIVNLNKKNKNRKMQTGGNLVLDSAISTKKKLDDLYSLIDKHQKNTQIANENNKYMTGHIIYLMSISNGKLFQGNNYVYDYIGKSMINFYNSVIDDILKIYKKGGKDKDAEIPDFVFSRDKVTLIKLNKFLSVINQKIKPDDVISINECTGETHNRFILLNYYKHILEDFKAKKLNKITMYARINDIKGLINPEVNPETFEEQKLFMSDVERFEWETKKLIKDPKTSDPKIMRVNVNACSALANKKLTIEENDLKFRFTEVFDSYQYQDNNSLAQYMGLNSLLTKKTEKPEQKNGVVLMTYGYSGTGKTYTLFGKEKTSGILQSTLSTIKNLEQVYFRLYEVYGYGLPYPHYWGENDKEKIDEEKIDKKKRNNKISHKIFQYKLDDSPDILHFNEIIQNSGKKLSAFIEDYDTDTKETYKKISSNNIDEIFNKFSDFMDIVEKFRENKDESLGEKYKIIQNERRRIRDTNNNIVSSRSILIYDFFIKFKEDNNIKEVPFLIVDLPGREEIIQTYVDPYFGDSSETIKKIYAKGKNMNVNSREIQNDMIELKMLFTLMALNPIGISLFDPEDIIRFFNEDLEFDTKFGKQKEGLFDAIIETTYDIDETEVKGLTANTANTTKQFRDNGPSYNVKKTKSGKFYVDGVNSRNGFKFEEEIINYKGANLGYFCNINKDKKNNAKINIINVENLFGYSTKYQICGLACVHLINRILMLGKFDILYYIYKYITNKYLNSILKDGVQKITTDELKTIFSELQNDNFKRELISRVPNLNNLDDSQKREELIKIIINDYYLAPFEGIYINENIAGIIKYLSVNENLIVVEATDETEKQKKLEIMEKNLRNMEQDKSLNFQKQQKLVRMWLTDNKSLTEIANFYNMEDEILSKLNPAQSNIVRNMIDKSDGEIKEFKKYSEASPKDQPSIKSGLKFITINFDKNIVDYKETEKILEELNIVPKFLLNIKGKDISFNHDNLKTEYEKIKDVYKSDKIFNFDETLIQDILNPYLKHIADFKVLYLFGNYLDSENGKAREMKCEHQYKLLNNTRNFISNIVESQLVEKEEKEKE